jgi:hypothetical protein
MRKKEKGVVRGISSPASKAFAVDGKARLNTEGTEEVRRATEKTGGNDAKTARREWVRYKVDS